MRFVVYDTLSIQKQIFGLTPNLRSEYISKRLLAPFKDSVNAELGMFRPDGPLTEYQENIKKLEQAGALKVCKDALEKSYRYFWEAKYTLNLNEVRFGLFLGDKESIYLSLKGGYSSSLPKLGYVLLSVWPDDYTLQRLPLAVSHEFNHQMRLSCEPIGEKFSLGRYIIFEGLAEVFSEHLFGKELLGSWITQISAHELEKSKRMIGKELNLDSLYEIKSFMLGDELAKLYGNAPLGLPHAAGYAVGYHLIQAYLKETGKSIIEATMTPSDEILETSGFFK